MALARPPSNRAVASRPLSLPLTLPLLLQDGDGDDEDEDEDEDEDGRASHSSRQISSSGLRPANFPRAQVAFARSCDAEEDHQYT